MDLAFGRRGALILIFALAIGLRLWFLSGIRAEEVMLYGDAVNYDGSAIGIIEMFKNALPNLSFIVKQAMAGTLGKGANILHAIGIHFSITVFLQGPVYPFFIASLYAIFGHAISVVQYGQALISAISCILLFFAAAKAFGDRRIGFIAAVIWALYLPAIYFTEIILTETVGAFVLILLVMALLRVSEKPGYAPIFISGLVTALLMLTKHSFRFLWIFLLIALLFSVKAQGLKEVLKRAGVFLCGVGILLIPWMSLIAFATGDVMSLPSSKDYWREVYLNNDPSGDGWPPDSSLGITKLEKPSPYKKLLIDNIRKYPIRTELLYLEKMRRVWARYVNIRSRFFLVSDDIFLSAHRLFVYLALVGMILALADWRKYLSIITVVLYTTLLSSVLLVEARYNFVTMPIIIMFAGYFIVKCADGILKIFHSAAGFRKELSIIAIALALFPAVKFFVRIPFVLSVFKGMDFDTAYMFKMAGDCILPLFTIPAVYIMLKGLLKRKYLLCTCFVPVFILIASQCASGLDDRNKREWSANIIKGAAVYKEILMPQDAKNISGIKEVNLLIDMIKPARSDLDININGRSFSYNAIHKKDRFEPRVYDELFRWRRFSPDMLRRWGVVTIPPERLKEGKVKITVSSKGPAVIFGDYKSGDEKVYQGPSFARSADETSCYKLGYGDYRLPWEERLYNVGTRDHLYINGMEKDTGMDLSECAGLQSGEYRIRLEIIYKDGTIKTY